MTSDITLTSARGTRILMFILVYTILHYTTLHYTTLLYLYIYFFSIYIYTHWNIPHYIYKDPDVYVVFSAPKLLQQSGSGPAAPSRNRGPGNAEVKQSYGDVHEGLEWQFVLHDAKQRRSGCTVRESYAGFSLRYGALITFPRM